jgi:transcriptional regulator with XRE-family HTH domain
LAVIVARQIIGRRHKAGWKQAELAVKAGVRLETVRRIESAQRPTGAAVDKIDRALRQAGV